MAALAELHALAISVVAVPKQALRPYLSHLRKAGKPTSSNYFPQRKTGSHLKARSQPPSTYPAEATSSRASGISLAPNPTGSWHKSEDPERRRPTGARTVR